MARHPFPNAVREQVTAQPGLTAFSFDGAAANTGPIHQAFQDAGLADGALVLYEANDGKDREIGVGTWDDTAKTLSRSDVNVSWSTNANNRVDFSTLRPVVRIDVPQSWLDTLDEVRDLLDVDGSPGQVLGTDGAGTRSWQTPAGAVSISGTPAANQITRWTDPTTVTGNPQLTHDPTTGLMKLELDQNTGTTLEVNNPNAGASAYSRFIARSDTASASYLLSSSGTAQSGRFYPNGLLIENDLGSITLNTSAAGEPIRFYRQNTNLILTVDTDGLTLSTAGAKILTTDTGDLNLQTGGGDGNIVLRPDGTGIIDAVGVDSQFESVRTGFLELDDTDDSHVLSIVCGDNLTGNRTLTLFSLNNNASFNLRASAASLLLGRGSGSAGSWQNITLSTSLLMTGTVLGLSATPDIGTPSAGVLTNCTGLPTAGLVNDAVTYAKMQDISGASRLLGRGSAGGAGDPEEITLGANLTMTGTVLSATGGGSSEWTNTGTTLHPNTTTDEVVIGGTSPISSAKLSIDGDADQIQCLIQGNATQTNDILVIEQSGGSDLFRIENGGKALILNRTDAASNEALRIQGNDGRSGPGGVDGDNAYIALYLDDSAGTPAEFGRMIWVARDSDSASKDGTIRLQVMENNTLVTVLRVRDDLLTGAKAGNDTMTGTGNVCLGERAGESLTSGNNNLFVGATTGINQTTASNNVGVGADALQQVTASPNIGVGSAAMRSNTSGARNVAIGNNANANMNGMWDTVCIGDLAVANAFQTVAIGSKANVTKQQGIAIGFDNDCVHDDCIVIGGEITTTADNQCLIGGANREIATMIVGRGDTHATPVALTVRGTDASGTNVAGVNMILRPSRGTGTGGGGSLKVQTAPPGGSGSALNAAADAAEFDDDATAGNTRFLLWDVTAGSLRRVAVSADTDTAGNPFLTVL